jgi:hypothetical protein
MVVTVVWMAPRRAPAMDGEVVGYGTPWIRNRER